MLDYIDHTGFVYRTAYPFSYKPRRVHICLLPYRFVVFGILRLVISFLAWLFPGAIFGVMFWVLFGLPNFLAGRRFFYDENSPFDEGHIIGEKLLNRLIFLNYTSVRIKKLPVIGGKRILPWHVVVAVLIPLALWYIAPMAAGLALSAEQGISAGAVWLWGEFMSLHLWMPIALVIGLLVLAVVSNGVVAFRKSEMYALCKMSVKAKMDKICPILPVK